MILDLVLIALSLVLAFLLVRNVRRMREVKDFVFDLARGNIRRRSYPKGKDDYTRLMFALSSLAEQLEDRTDESEELRSRLEAVLRNIPDGLALLDEGDRVRLINPAFEKLFDASESDLVNKELTKLKIAPAAVQLIRTAKENNTGKTGEFEFADRHLQVMTLPFSGKGGRHLGAIVLFRDITAQKRVDQVRRDFVANVSHELKTPITAIKGFAETLLDGAVENREDALRFLGTIVSHTERMERLIQDLITLSKIEFGAIPVEKKLIDLDPVVSDALALMEEGAKKKGLALTKKIEDDCGRILADPVRLQQILINLLDNAVKFTETGSVRVRAGKDGAGHCVISVEDTGIGIPEKYIPRLGERFFRVDPSRSRKLGSTGLGLAIVKHLVLTHGWRLRIESEVGRGTTVKILL